MSALGLQIDIDDTGTIEYSEFISAALLATKSRNHSAPHPADAMQCNNILVPVILLFSALYSP